MFALENNHDFPSVTRHGIHSASRSWAFVLFTDTVYRLVASAENSDGRYAMDNAMMIYLFMTAVLPVGGFLLTAKFHRVSAWLAARRANL